MNLSVSSISNGYANNNNVNFGMAKFSQRGYELAGGLSDIYESLAKPNTFHNPDFFKRSFPLIPSPFTKYYLANAESSTQEVAQTIVDCGSTNNADANAKFIGQLLNASKYIHSASDSVKETIGNAVNEVFKKNWDNPEISKKDTLKLLELAKYGMDDRAYVTLNGAVMSSDTKDIVTK